jgi:putative flippase GtrA
VTRWARFAVFTLVGVAGVSVQLGCLTVLTGAVRLHYLPATALAVAVSAAHNFVWHWWWTWRDRRAAMMPTFVRFLIANGAVSLAGNLGVMATLVSGAGMHPVAANAIAIAVCGLLNFWIGDAVVFRAT